MKKRSSLKNSGLASLFRGAAEREQSGSRPPGRGSGEREAAGREEGEAAKSRAPEESAEREGGSGSADSGVSVPGRPPRRRELFQTSRSFPAVIRVVGVGGGGTNAVNRMLEANLEGVEFIAINTDAQALAMSEADHKLRIGRELTKGLGGGSDPHVGRDAALAAYDDIKALLKGSDMVFVTAGEGGGTGTGAAPVIAEIARSVGALTIGVVSKPFAFEGKRRQKQAEEGIVELREKADTVIVVPNDRLLEVVERGTSMLEALRVADDVLRQGVQGICDLVTVPGLINLDLADVRTIMTGAGTAHMGIGAARGEQRAAKAADMAVNSSLLETSIEGARGILLNISGGEDLSLFEVNEVAEIVNEAAHPDANIIFGAVVDPSLGEQLLVTVVAAGFEGRPRPLSGQAEEESAAEAPEPRETEVPAGTALGEIPEWLPRGAERRTEPERGETRVPEDDQTVAFRPSEESPEKGTGGEESRGEAGETEELDIPSFLRRDEES